MNTRTLALLIALATVATVPAPAQQWRGMVKWLAVASLEMDYSQVCYGYNHHYSTSVFGYVLDCKSAAAVNGAEIAANLWAPRRLRPWFNVATFLFHIPYIVHEARKQIGLTYGPGGERPWRIGFRITPW